MKTLFTTAALALVLCTGAAAQSAMPSQTPVPSTMPAQTPVQATPVPSTMPSQTPVPSILPNANQTPEAPANGTMPNANGAVTSGGRVKPNGTIDGNASATAPIPPSPQCPAGVIPTTTCLPPYTNCLPGQPPLPNAGCPSPHP